MNTGITLPPHDLAAALHNTLRQRFFEAGKTEAKQLFLALKRGDATPFMEINVRDKGDVQCDLKLDEDQYDGRLNFSHFRTALDAHLERLAAALNGRTDLNIYKNDDFRGLVYNHPGVVRDEDRVNFLLTGIRQTRPGLVTVYLFFVDPAIVGV